MSDTENQNGEEIQIPADEPVVVEIAEGNAGAEVEKKPEKTEDEREIALREIRQQLEEQKAVAERERQAREAAERMAREQAFAAKAAKVEGQDANLRSIVNAIDSAEQNLNAAERAYADAMAGGDYQTAAKAQSYMAKVQARILQLENGKAALEERLQQATHEGRVTPEEPERAPPPPPRDPVELVASQLTPKSAAWLRNHPAAATQINLLTAAHTLATEKHRIPVESEEYFAFIEQELGLSAQKSEPKSAKPASKSALSGVPVNSGSSMAGTSRSSNPNAMVLDPTEIEIALLNEPNLPRQKALEIYARNKAALIREGKLSTHRN